MSDWRFPQDDGHTPLSEEDRQGLLLSHIATRDDLNDAEQRNIAKALRRRAPTVDKLLDDMYLRGLHKAMFGEVWEWAGKYRQRVTNVGIAPAQISTDLRTLTGDAKEWVEHRYFEPDELAVRFHHRLVTIHPFPDGNGRHSRISADYLAQALNRSPFSWGAHLDLEIDALRRTYLTALRTADRGDISPLLSFARN
ncbi:MAG: mobile mystery protein B [Acidimicrobiales bacterium]|nr:mobile mystery protein B [Acidimicrobiaceae bacterium]MXV88514.1 mobile mystery protein B [Acidimicrobiales bacterium]MCY3609430.1 mobile mystery protein B [Acidimicrobiaceae bacterium]MDE0676712.1 mobile mystery protein B [Acidimicrobiaceae bacterium]MYB80343.1 mobile mystery protein B [Acidimicrobiales bacterium]